MTLKNIGTTFTTKDIEKARAFYEKHFNAKTVFDCGWYLMLSLKAEENLTVSFMKPQDDTPLYQGGICLNIEFDAVEPIHKKLIEEGLKEVMPLEDHPWGDRGFAVMDPIGTTVYCYHETEPTEEYKKFYSQDAIK